MTLLPLPCLAALLFVAAVVVFLFAVAIARAARDIEPVDDGRGFGGDSDE